MAGGCGLGTAMRRRVMREENYTCALCGIVGYEKRYRGPCAKNACYTFPTSVEGVFLSIDHIVPKSKGGTHERSNLRVLCVPCNTRKGTKPAEAA